MRLIRLFLTLIVLLLLIAALWLGRHHEPLAGWLASARKAGTGMWASPTGKADQAAAPRKCLQGGRVLYTDGPCPAGSREQAVSDDRLTVVPATPVPVPAAAAAAASGLPNARDILGRPDDGTLRDQRMERQINSN